MENEYKHRNLLEALFGLVNLAIYWCPKKEYYSLVHDLENDIKKVLIPLLNEKPIFYLVEFTEINCCGVPCKYSRNLKDLDDFLSFFDYLQNHKCTIDRFSYLVLSD